MRISKLTYLRIYIIVLLLGTASCTSKKNVVSADVKSLPTKKIINEHYASSFNKKTINAKLNARYDDGRTSVGISIKMRMEKDKKIWLSATKLGIPIAKILITPTEVMYYEKINRTFFLGDFSLLSSALGTELDFQQVQNLLLGQSILDLKKGKYVSTTSSKGYELLPKKQSEEYLVQILLNPTNFKLSKQQVETKNKKQLLAISYPDYMKIQGEQVPKEIKLKATDEKHVTNIDIEYKSLEFNKKLTYPFAIPKGYKQIIIN